MKIVVFSQKIILFYVMSVDIFIRGDELFRTYHGAFVENYVAQQLIACRICESDSLYYWRNRGGQAEVDFVVTLNTGPYPLEVKAGVNPKSRSLAIYHEKYAPPALLRSNLLNLMRSGAFVNIPLYALFLLSRLPIRAE